MPRSRASCEWAPELATDYLGDRTAFDAFIEYRTPDHRLHALGIETKLTESFSAKVHDREEYLLDARPQLAVAAGCRRARRGRRAQPALAGSPPGRHQAWSPYATSRSLVVHHSGETWS
jgi:hypothetical protein